MIELKKEKDQTKAIASIKVNNLNFEKEAIELESKMIGYPKTTLVENINKLDQIITRAPGAFGLIPLIDEEEWVGLYIIPRDLTGCYFIPLNIHPHFGNKAKNINFQDLKTISTLSVIPIASFENKIVQKKFYKELGFMTPNYCDFKLMAKYLNENIKTEHLFDVYLFFERNKYAIKEKQQYHHIILNKKLPFKHMSIRSLLFYGDFLEDIVRALFEAQNKYFSQLPDSETNKHDLTEAARFFLMVEMELINILAKMEVDGIAIDFNEFEKIKQQLTEKKGKLSIQLNDELEGQIENIFPVFYDVTDDETLKDLLYKKMSLININEPNKQRVNAETLKSLSHQYPQFENIIEKIIKIRSIDTILNQLINQDFVNGKIYPHFDAFGTVTGRITTNNPNIQGFSKQMRRIIKANEGKVLIGCDFHQEEPRIVASLAQNKHLRDIFEKEDIYTELAKKVFQTSVIDAQQRDLVKTIFLALIYGASDFGIAKQLNITIEQVDKAKKALFSIFPEFQKIKNNFIELARKYGYIKTIGGRKRRFPVFLAPDYVFMRGGTYIPQALENVIRNDIFGMSEDKIKAYFNSLKKDGIEVIDNRNEKKQAERQTLNAYAQGSASDLLKEVIVRINRHPSKKRLGIEFKIFTHDEIVIEANEETKEEAKELLEEIMIQTFKEWFNFPISVSSYISKKWK